VPKPYVDLLHIYSRSRVFRIKFLPFKKEISKNSPMNVLPLMACCQRKIIFQVYFNTGKQDPEQSQHT
jgi:hypothetical protein